MRYISRKKREKWKAWDYPFATTTQLKVADEERTTAGSAQCGGTLPVPVAVGRVGHALGHTADAAPA